ncbi:transposase [Streptomyces sp. NPDC020792]|uniref:transposase n=1 Tax=Streptomyces sp. NPDC020792 TaxID=3365089 RepID=UPI00379C4712
MPRRKLRNLQVHVRAKKQTPDWQTRHAVCSGVEGTVNEFAHGHGMRRCRYRGQPKAHPAAHLQGHRREHRPPQPPATDGETPQSRPSTAFQNFLDWRGIPRVEVMAGRQRLTRSPTESGRSTQRPTAP